MDRKMTFKIDFDFSSIKQIELLIGLSDPPSYYQVMVNKDVQETLLRMLQDTASKIQATPYLDIPDFEFAEKYGAEETVKGSLAQEEFYKIKQIFELKGLEQLSNIFDAIDRLTHYMCKATDTKNHTIFGLRRGQQFKGLASSQGRLMGLFDDSLKILDEPVLKLDKDFDLLITLTEVFAIRPNALMYIAEADDAALTAAKERLKNIGKSIDFLELAGIQKYIEKHKTGAHLIASIYKRDDLKDIKKPMLKSACNQHSIKLDSNSSKQLGPAQGHEKAFLELLDNRRYASPLVEKNPTTFMATSRKKIKS